MIIRVKIPSDYFKNLPVRGEFEGKFHVKDSGLDPDELYEVSAKGTFQVRGEVNMQIISHINAAVVGPAEEVAKKFKPQPGTNPEYFLISRQDCLYVVEREELEGQWG